MHPRARLPVQGKALGGQPHRHGRGRPALGGARVENFHLEVVVGLEPGQGPVRLDRAHVLRVVGLAHVARRPPVAREGGVVGSRGLGLPLVVVVMMAVRRASSPRVCRVPGLRQRLLPLGGRGGPVPLGQVLLFFLLLDGCVDPRRWP